MNLNEICGTTIHDNCPFYLICNKEKCDEGNQCVKGPKSFPICFEPFFVDDDNREIKKV